MRQINVEKFRYIITFMLQQLLKHVSAMEDLSMWSDAKAQK